LFWSPAVNSLLLERPTQLGPRLDEGRQRELEALVRKLEAWLPAEEERLERAREQGSAQLRRERDWQDLLRLYERLSLALN
jgi:hypothetical protein